MKHVRGSIVAFIDNDGYADPGWLAAAVTAMDSDATVGVVASVVFFAGRKIILNGAGGTVNLQGYGGDYCFETPYEFAQLPSRVLYAMGCGMVARRDVLDRIGPLDEKLFNYYDDTELGIRAWKSGYEVAVAPDAWIDHGFGFSDRIPGNKALLCERNRIRTVLKYFPIRLLPIWLAGEAVFTSRLSRDRWSTIIRAWRWNLIHLPSALGLRIRFASRRGRFSHLIAPTWGHYPPPVPNNQANHPDLAHAHSEVVLDGRIDAHQLNFGWYQVENDGDRAFRWSASRASVLFRLRAPVINCTMAFAGSNDREARIMIRPLGSLDPCLDETFTMAGTQWTWRTFPIHLPAGDYELLILCDDVLIDGSARSLGIAVSLIRFE
jgi:GT2 family glycosyltransferase